MNTNLAHDVFINQGKSEPVQIPFGKSGLSTGNGIYQSPQIAMQRVMAYNVEKNGKQIDLAERPLTTEQVRHKFNYEAKHKALKAGLSEFTGKCIKHDLTAFKAYQSGKHHCIECRAIIIKRKKETSLLNKFDRKLT